MKRNLFGIWAVRVSLPKDDSKGRKWAVNENYQVVTTSAERAIEVVKEMHTDCTIFGVHHRGSYDEVILDPEYIP